jgi:hypothetical protein
MVTGISMALKLEKPSTLRYVAISMDLCMMIITLALRFTVVNEYGENGDKRYLLYMLITITCNAVQFVLTKLLLQKSKISIITFAMWVYLFGMVGSFGLYCIECVLRGHWTVKDMPSMLFLIEEVITVFLFSCLNEVANYLLLLYFIRKTLVTKASIYGIVGSIFIIFFSIFKGKITSVLLWSEIVVFLSAYMILFLMKRHEKRINKGKAIAK